jgi:hypothetical protein
VVFRVWDWELGTGGHIQFSGRPRSCISGDMSFPLERLDEGSFLVPRLDTNLEMGSE